MAKLAIATGHAMHLFSTLYYSNFYIRNVLSLTYLDAGLLA
jgi:hypothetical protein